MLQLLRRLSEAIRRETKRTLQAPHLIAAQGICPQRRQERSLRLRCIRGRIALALTTLRFHRISMWTTMEHMERAWRLVLVLLAYLQICKRNCRHLTLTTKEPIQDGCPPSQQPLPPFQIARLAARLARHCRPLQAQGLDAFPMKWFNPQCRPVQRAWRPVRLQMALLLDGTLPQGY
jgi:hypothetical protein